MYCHIAKDKKTNEEFLIPACWSIINMWHIDMPDRQIIKEYCTCDRRTRRGKYETKTRDEVISMIQNLEAKIMIKQEEIEKMKEELDWIKTEVFMLNIIEET